MLYCPISFGYIGRLCFMLISNPKKYVSLLYIALFVEMLRSFNCLIYGNNAAITDPLEMVVCLTTVSRGNVIFNL